LTLVDVSDFTFGVQHANVEVEGPFEYNDARFVKTSPTAS